MRFAKLFLGFLGLAFFAVAGCDELGRIGDLGDYGGIGSGSGSDVIGEIQRVDSRARTIEIRADSGRTTMVSYDNNTKVIYKQNTYPVANLERGDYVVARIQQDRDGRSYTDTITVREASQDRGYSSGNSNGNSRGNRLDTVEGRVEYVDPRRGTFELRDQRDRLVVVSVAFNAPRTVADRFNRLREGDYVRIEGRSVSADRFDLENFL
jgi:hypothetical protein